MCCSEQELYLQTGSTHEFCRYADPEALKLPDSRHRHVKSSEFYSVSRALPQPLYIPGMLLVAVRLYKGTEHANKFSTNKLEHEHKH